MNIEAAEEVKATEVEMAEFTRSAKAAVEENVKRVAKDEGEKKPDPQFPSADETDDDDAKGGAAPDEQVDDEEDDDGKAEITDAQVERAVKAGMTMTDARAFKHAESLDRVCDLLESAKVAKAPEADAEKSGDGEVRAIEFDLDAIPDLDPEEYDEKVVAAVKALKGMVGQLQGRLDESSRAGRETWFDSQIRGLGEGFKDALGDGPASQATPEQAVKRGLLETKFKILEAGYKAAGGECDRGLIFKEATSLALGDVAAQVEEAERSGKLAKRATQHVNRPGKSRAKPVGSPIETAAAVADQFIGKNKSD